MKTDFLSERQTGIGGSDVAAVLGIETAFKTRFELWEEKVYGTQKKIANQESLRIGKLLEEPLIRFYMSSHINGCSGEFKLENCFRHPEHSFLIANIDGIISKPERKILEIKTANEFTKGSWGESGSHKIPPHYYAQIAHYMLVLDYDCADLMVGFVTNKIKERINNFLSNFYLGDDEETEIDHPSLIVSDMETRIYSFKRNKDIDAILIKECKDFWENHVLKKVPPEKDFSNKHFLQYVKQANESVDEGQTKVFPDDFLSVKKEYIDVGQKISELQKTQDSLKAKILDSMGSCEVGKFSDGDYFLRKLVKRKESFIKASEYVKLTLKKQGVIDE